MKRSAQVRAALIPVRFELSGEKPPGPAPWGWGTSVNCLFCYAFLCCRGGQQAIPPRFVHPCGTVSPGAWSSQSQPEARDAANCGPKHGAAHCSLEHENHRLFPFWGLRRLRVPRCGQEKASPAGEAFYFSNPKFRISGCGGQLRQPLRDTLAGKRCGINTYYFGAGTGDLTVFGDLDGGARRRVRAPGSSGRSRR